MHRSLGESIEPKQELDPCKADILIAKDEWGRAVSPQVIGAVGLGSYTGIAVYNSRLKEGYIGNFGDPSTDYSEVQYMLRTAKHNNATGDIRVWVRGGYEDTNSLSGVEYTPKSREFLKNLITESDIFYLDIQLSDSAFTVVDMALDCETGAFISIDKALS